jgi:hypothetical protein
MAVVKRYADWNCDLQDFLRIGDLVDEDFVDYFISVLPPACYNSQVIQIGEPYSHVEGGATYSTLMNTADGWAYAGHCLRGQTTHFGR